MIRLILNQTGMCSIRKAEPLTARMTYATEEERIAARRNAWARYNRAHKAERCEHNKAHVQKEYVKARRRERYAERVALYHREGSTIAPRYKLNNTHQHQHDRISPAQAENNISVASQIQGGGHNIRSKTIVFRRFFTDPREA